MPTTEHSVVIAALAFLFGWFVGLITNRPSRKGRLAFFIRTEPLKAEEEFAVFGGNITSEERAIIQIPVEGLSAKGAVIPLENVRLELADPADPNGFVDIHEDGTPGKFMVTAKSGFVGPTADVNVIAKADGEPGTGVSEFSETGVISIRLPSAQGFSGAIGVVVEPLP